MPTEPSRPETTEDWERLCMQAREHYRDGGFSRVGADFLPSVK